MKNPPKNHPQHFFNPLKKGFLVFKFIVTLFNQKSPVNAVLGPDAVKLSGNRYQYHRHNRGVTVCGGGCAFAGPSSSRVGVADCLTALSLTQDKMCQSQHCL